MKKTVNKRMMKLLFELMKDSSRSDRKLAKVLGVSQSTVTRMRNKLVKDGMIRQFTIIPDFERMGYEILAITCFKGKAKKEFIERAKKWAIAKPNIIFAGRTEGMGKNGVMISIHRNFARFSEFFGDLMLDWGDDVEEYGTLLTPLQGIIVKPFSLKYLAEVEETSGD